MPSAFFENTVVFKTYIFLSCFRRAFVPPFAYFFMPVFLSMNIRASTNFGSPSALGLNIIAGIVPKS
jgi:hypothetical protein